jgi:lysosomal acid lipase/cholesteryl ester hydrolase
VNASRIQVYLSQAPAGTSTLNILHWVQGITTPTFQMFDFCSEESNQAHYGANQPPAYDLSKLAVPTALFYGKHDYMADTTDVDKLIQEAGPSGMIQTIEELDSFAHLDYVWGKDANRLVYDKVVALLLKKKS